MRLMFCVTVALAATSSWAADVYRSVSPEGTVIYSDRPGPNSVPIIVATARPIVPATPRVPAARPVGPVAEGVENGANAASRPESTAGTAEERARNCATAEERLESYRNSHRLYRSLPNGEREYLNDAEIDEARARAAADVENWCN